MKEQTKPINFERADIYFIFHVSLLYFRDSVSVSGSIVTLYLLLSSAHSMITKSQKKKTKYFLLNSCLRRKKKKKNFLRKSRTSLMFATFFVSGFFVIWCRYHFLPILLLISMLSGILQYFLSKETLALNEDYKNPVDNSTSTL